MRLHKVYEYHSACVAAKGCNICTAIPQQELARCTEVLQGERRRMVWHGVDVIICSIFYKI